MDKAKHAYGSRAKLSEAIASGAVDSYDVLFLQGEGETPAIGWVDKNGNPVVLSPADDLAEAEAKLEAEIAKKANAEDVETLESQIAAKADSAEIVELEAEVAKKADVKTVQSMINEATVGVIEVVEF